MFEGIDISLQIVLLEAVVAFYCFSFIVSLTKNGKLAGLGLGFALIMGIINTAVVLEYPYYWVLVIAATLGCVVYGLKRSPDARKNIIKKLSDVERTIYILPVILIVTIGIYAISTYTPRPQTIQTVAIGKVSMELPSYWNRDINDATHQVYSCNNVIYLNNIDGTVILEIVEPSTKNTPGTLSKSLKNEINQLYSGKLFDDDYYSLISGIEKSEISLDGGKAFIYSYYFTYTDDLKERSNYVHYAKDVFFVYHNQLYRFTFYHWGSRYALFVPTVKQETLKFVNHSLSTVTFE